MRRSHHLADYLQAIYFLGAPAGRGAVPAERKPVAAARIAKLLAVTAPTVGEMLKRLEGDGLITRGARRGALLTRTGQREAERFVRNHRIIECFVTQTLGYSAAESHERAATLASSFSDDITDRLLARLGRPERCPHGWPIDPASPAACDAPVVALGTLEPGSAATIRALAEHDTELIAWFFEYGYAPGSRLVVARVDAAAGLMLVVVDGDERPISLEAAESLYVTVDGPEGR